MDPIVGVGYPEGKVAASAGTAYLDAGSGLWYYKSASSSAADKNGWAEAGDSSPDHSLAPGDSTPDISGYKRYRVTGSNITDFVNGRDQQIIFLILDRYSSIQANANIAEGISGPSRVSYMLDAGQWHIVVTRSIA